MTPEQMFRAFLEVWDREPEWEVFKNSNAIDGLEKLKQIIRANINSDNATLEEKIWEWCEDYPVLTENIHHLNRGKLKVTQRLPLNPNNPLDNRYPDIRQELQQRSGDNNTPTPAQ